MVFIGAKHGTQGKVKLVDRQCKGITKKVQDANEGLQDL